MFDIEQRSDGWAVINRDTGQVAVVNGVPQTGMALDDADDLADLLNRLEREKPAQPN